MGALTKNPRYELFAQAVVRGLPASRAYVEAGYSANGADSLAVRLMGNASVLGRIDELQSALEQSFVVGEIGRREARIAALNDRWLKCKALIRARGLDLANIPGGSTGLLVRKSKREGDEYLFDVGLMSEMRAIEQQAAQELGHWRAPDEQPVVQTGPAIQALGFRGTFETLLVRLDRFTGETES